MLQPEADVRAAVEAFDVGGRCVAVEPWGSGHIHDSFAVRVEGRGAARRYLIQRFNARVFPEPQRVMENIRRVTEHLQSRLRAEGDPDAARGVLRVVATREGADIVRGRNGVVWRAFDFIEGARSIDEVERAEQAYEAARAFGRFQALLCDLPPPRLHETIAGFHHTPSRFAALRDAVERDPLGRVADALDAIDFALAREPLSAVLADALASGRIPERVTHNDAKINNVLFDSESDRAFGVIDLDTVMPGAVGFDFGGCVRTMTCPAAEDERDLGLIEVRIDLFEAVARGYLEAARPFLTAAELDGLVDSGRLIAFEDGLRFLADYLTGDTYYKTSRPGQNLDRARVQFRLVESAEERDAELQEIVDRCR